MQSEAGGGGVGTPPTPPLATGLNEGLAILNEVD